MAQALLKWSLILGALLLVGPLAWLMTGTLHGPDGGHDTTPLLSVSPVWGFTRALIALGLAGGAGWAVMKKVTPAWGLFTTGMVLAWAAWGTGSIDALVRVSPEKGTLWVLAVEGVLLAAPAVALAWALTRHVASGAEPADRRFGRKGPSRLAGDGIGFGIALIAGIVASWAVAQNTLKGQTVAAAAMGGILAGVVVTGGIGSLRPRPAALVAGVAALAFAGPALGAVFESSAVGLVQAANGGALAPPARVLPLDWIAGAFLGVPVGLSLLGSIMETSEPGKH